jgi:hypothetical protein
MIQGVQETGQGVQETGQENCEQRDETRDRKQKGENLKECTGDFVVFTYVSGLLAGRVAQVKKC